jgi:hypothetical protein
VDTGALSVATWVAAVSSSPLTEDARTGKVLICLAEWGFLTNHARVLLQIAHDPGAGPHDIAASPGVTERRAHSILT